MAESYSEFQKSWEEQLTRDAATSKATCIAALEEAGAVWAKCEYDGSGDSGWITSTIIYGPAGRIMEENHDYYEAGGSSLINTVRACAGAALYKVAPGWEINDGAFGEIIINAEDGRIIIKHNARFSDYSTYDYET